MADQSRDAAITALMGVLATVTGLSASNITDEPMTPNSIGEDKLPYCVVEEYEEQKIDRNVTSQREIVLDVAITVYYKALEGAATGGRAIADSMIKKLEAAAEGLLSGTVSNIEVLPARFGAVRIKGPMKARGRLVRLYLDQDFD